MKYVDLSEFLDKEGIGPPQMAKRCGVTRQTMCRRKNNSWKVCVKKGEAHWQYNDRGRATGHSEPYSVSV